MITQTKCQVATPIILFNYFQVNKILYRGRHNHTITQHKMTEPLLLAEKVFISNIITINIKKHNIIVKPINSSFDRNLKKI